MTRFVNLLAAGLCLLLGSGACTRLERAYLPEPEASFPRLTRFAEEPSVSVDHAGWTEILQEIVVTDSQGVNRIPYGKVDLVTRRLIKTYIRSLEDTPVTRLTRAQQLAYWINLYNAVVVRTVLDFYPVDSIREISFQGLFTFGPWSEPLVRVEGQSLSLNDIEHRILRPVFQEPRIHYALNCAAVQCPNLAKQAWEPERLDADLTAAARAYVNDPRGVRVADDGDLVLSKIYAWFREDFGGTPDTVRQHLSRYADADLRAVLADQPDIDDYVYDWSLIDAAAAPVR